MGFWCTRVYEKHQLYGITNVLMVLNLPWRVLLTWTYIYTIFSASLYWLLSAENFYAQELMNSTYYRVHIFMISLIIQTMRMSIYSSRSSITATFSILVLLRKYARTSYMSHTSLEWWQLLQLTLSMLNWIVSKIIKNVYSHFELYLRFGLPK